MCTSYRLGVCLLIADRIAYSKWWNAPDRVQRLAESFLRGRFYAFCRKDFEPCLKGRVRVLADQGLDYITRIDMKVSFSLSNKNTKPLGVAPPLAKPAAFSSLDDEDTRDVVPVASSSKNALVNKTHLADKVASSKATQKRMEQEMKIDATVYEYDEVWDRMQEVKQRQKEAKEADGKQRKVGVYCFVFD